MILILWSIGGIEDHRHLQQVMLSGVLQPRAQDDDRSRQPYCLGMSFSPSPFPPSLFRGGVSDAAPF